MLRSIATLFALGTLATAQAVPLKYDFQYTLDGGRVLSGSLLGDRDNDTIIVRSILDFVDFDGKDGPSLPYVESLLQRLNGPVTDPIVSLNGSLMDMIACPDESCTDGFYFETSTSPLGYAAYNGGTSFGGDVVEEFAPSRWQIQAAAPEPGTLPLAALSLAGLMASRRRGMGRRAARGRGKR